MPSNYYDSATKALQPKAKIIAPKPASTVAGAVKNSQAVLDATKAK